MRNNHFARSGQMHIISYFVYSISTFSPIYKCIILKWTSTSSVKIDLMATVNHIIFIHSHNHFVPKITWQMVRWNAFWSDSILTWFQMSSIMDTGMFIAPNRKSFAHFLFIDWIISIRDYPPRIFRKSYQIYKQIMHINGSCISPFESI